MRRDYVDKCGRRILTLLPKVYDSDEHPANTEYREALRACENYHCENNPIAPNSAQHNAYKRLWKVAREKGNAIVDN